LRRYDSRVDSHSETVMPETKKHYRVRHYDSVRNDSVIGPALRFAEHVYPEDVGMPVDYACIIW